MNKKLFTPQQNDFIFDPELNGKTWLSGKTGTGKTTAAVERIQWILNNSMGYPNVLVFTPTLNHKKTYLEISSKDGLAPECSSFDTYVQKCLSLFWPIAANSAKLKNTAEPFFLDVDGEQIIMSSLIKKKVERGYFAALSSPLSRVFNQIVIAIHKMASAMIPFEKYAEIMKESWGGDKSMFTVFDQTQECGIEFRNYCLEHNMLDYSLRLEFFNNYLLPSPIFRNWIKKQRIHFFFDNVEEEVPAAHHFVASLAGEFDSVTLISDNNGGFRSFMGCDPVSADMLRTICDKEIEFEELPDANTEMVSLEYIIENPKLANADLPANPAPAFEVATDRQYARMIKNAAIQVDDLIHNKGVDPQRIVILSPLVPDLLYTEIERELRERGIKAYLNRPSRPLTNEKITHSLLVLCSLINPVENFPVHMLDIVEMLQCFIEDLDPMRAQILVEDAFVQNCIPGKDMKVWSIKSFENLPQKTKQRMTKKTEEKFEFLRKWIESQQNKNSTAPDEMIYGFFNDVLITDGFISTEETNINVCKIINSMRQFKRTMNCTNDCSISPEWGDYFNAVALGVIKASYREEMYAQPKDAVLVSLVSSYLSMNRHDDYQIWLNIASPKWRERFSGELTNDAILSRRWIPGSVWTVMTAEAYNDSHMIRQVCGLLRLCNKKIFTFASEMDERGLAQRGKLLNVFSTLTRRFPGLKKAFSEPENIGSKDPDEDILGTIEQEGVYPDIF